MKGIRPQLRLDPESQPCLFCNILHYDLWTAASVIKFIRERDIATMIRGEVQATLKAAPAKAAPRRYQTDRQHERASNIRAGYVRL